MKLTTDIYIPSKKLKGRKKKKNIYIYILLIQILKTSHLKEAQKAVFDVKFKIMKLLGENLGDLVFHYEFSRQHIKHDPWVVEWW